MTPNGPDSKSGDPFAPDLLPDRTLEGRLRALGLGDTQPDAGSPDAPIAITEPAEVHEGTSDPRLTAIGAQLNTLASGLANHRVQLRDAERSLVDRIADVDDDRRRAQGQMLRALQTQRDELEARLRHQGWLTAMALLLIGALAGGGLYLVHQRMAGAQGRLAETQGPLTAEVKSLRDEVARLSGIESQGALVQEKLDTLSSAVGALSSSLGEVTDQRGEVSEAASPGAPALLEQIGRLEAEQQRLRGELRTLRAPGATATGRAEVVPEADAASIGADTPAPISEKPSRQAPGQTADTSSETHGEPTTDESAHAETVSTAEEAAESSDNPATASGMDAAANAEAIADQTYALQLIGFYSFDKLREFAAKGELPPEVYLRRETLRGRPWFVLIHSLHSSYADAQTALERLPPNLVAIDPWIRKLPAGTELVPIPTRPAP